MSIQSGSVRMTFYARLDDSEIYNEIGFIETPVDVVDEITDDTRQPGDAKTATLRVAVPLSDALRQLADRLDEKSP